MLCVDREPAVAGTFYSSDLRVLQEQLRVFFSEQENRTVNDISALIVPHAGYVYSGKVAASAYSLIDEDAEYENIFIIGTSHHVSFNGASVYEKGHYKTPLGMVPVNLQLAEGLIKSSEYVVYEPAAHLEEHTIEVQLPFLHFRLKHLKQIVPIVIGTKDSAVCKLLAEVLRPYFNNNNLFIFSSDFSHYPTYETACAIDSQTADIIVKNDPLLLQEYLQEEEIEHIPNLLTRLCGWSSVLTLLYLTEGEEYKYSKVRYMNSGDVRMGEKRRVVGYQSILVQAKNQLGENLREKDKKGLLEAARNAIVGHLRIEEEKEFPKVHAEGIDSAFVSVYVKDELRGCMGRFNANISLVELIHELALSAAFEDGRFEHLEEDDLNDLRIEISVLTPMKKINNIEQIELGRHGVYLVKNGRKGTFLPQVAKKTGWTLNEFLGHLARDKAHVGWDGWKDAELYVYEAIVFSDLF